MYRIFCLVLCLTIAGLAFGQIVIHQSDFASVGSSFTTRVSDEGVTVNIGSGGPNQTWTIPDQTWTQDIELWVDPTGTQYADSFPTANYCETSPSGTEYQYFRLAGNGFFSLGFAGEVQGQPAVLVYDNEALMLALPMTYPGNWTGVAYADLEVQPGYFATIMDSTVYVVDGWGTMNTPFGSWPMLRIQQHRFERMWLMGFPMDSSESYDYLWLGQTPPLRVEISSQGSTNPNFTTGRIRIVTSGAASAEPARGPVADRLSIGQNYPNPFNPTTLLPVELQHAGEVTVSIYDETGRLVNTISTQLSAGAHDLPIDGSQWSTGTYFARVQQGSQTLVQKMQLIK